MALKNKIVGSVAILIGLVLVFLVVRVIINLCTMVPTNPELIEGPHLFHKGDNVEVATFKIRHNKYIRDSHTFDKQAFHLRNITVHISGSDKSFRTKTFSEFEIPDSKYNSPGKTIVISDIEGDFEYFEDILIGNEVIDKEYNWIFGSGSLVILGDVFDRGDKVTECLWLIYKLELEAKEHGGQVHFILGNHEIMALFGDDRYVHKKYKRLVNAIESSYEDLFGQNTELGSWIRSKNVIEVIDNTLYVHGGISPELNELGLTTQEINEAVRRILNYDNRTEMIDEDLRQILFNSKGPFWYRGYLDDQITEEEIDEIRHAHQVDHIVIGHTIVPEISDFYNKKIIAIDVKRENQPLLTALMNEKGSFFVIDQNGRKTQL